MRLQESGWDAARSNPRINHAANPTRGIRIRVPQDVLEGVYTISWPLIRPSKLTTRENGGVGKDLSEGWNLNFAVGCTHACPFCYVDAIHKRFGVQRYGSLVLNRWGDYFLIPSNLEEAIVRTPWARWRGQEVMMSSTHDPYLPKLAVHARRILRRALEAGVRICLQTRSYLVVNDLDLLAEYRDQVRLQVSVATMSRELARCIEPRVPPPERRLDVLKRAKDAGLRVGIILAPVFPPVAERPDVEEDLNMIAERLASIHPDHIYGESLHVRGENLRLIEQRLGHPLSMPPSFDRAVREVFHRALRRFGLSGTWWPERHRRTRG